MIDLHVVEFEGRLYSDAIAVRDQLRRSPSDAHRWASAKQRAARAESASLMRYNAVRGPRSTSCSGVRSLSRR